MLRLIQLFYEVEHYDKWIPSISKPKTLKYFTKTKKVIYTKFDFPVIQERDILLYFFVNNKLKESHSIQFLFKSGDEEDSLKCRDIIKKNKDFIRMDLLISSFEIEILNNESLRLNGFIDLDPRLIGLDEKFVEIMVRQYFMIMLNNIESLLKLPEQEFENKIRKNLVKADSIDFYEFINKEIKKFSSVMKPKNEY